MCSFQQRKCCYVNGSTSKFYITVINIYILVISEFRRELLETLAPGSLLAMAYTTYFRCDICTFGKLADIDEQNGAMRLQPWTYILRCDLQLLYSCTQCIIMALTV